MQPINIVTWYAIERGKGKMNSPTFCVWTNKPQGLTAKADRMQVTAASSGG